MNKTIVNLSLFLLLLLSSCSQQAPYFNYDVDIDINVKQASYTFLQVEFRPTKNAFYYVDILPWDPKEIDPDSLGTHFETLVLDSAQILYTHWRHDLLMDLSPNIASFADHVLSYGNTEEYFLELKSDSTYLIFAFVVDPERLIPTSKVFYKLITTDTMISRNVNFDVTIDHYWDFVYPLDDNGDICADVPYYAMVASADEIKADTTAWNATPFLYFISKMSSIFTDKLPAKYNLGVSVRRHDNINSSECFFENGKTYYIGIGTTDVVYTQKGVTVYRIDYNEDGICRKYDHTVDRLEYDEW